jgi:hypothetical protein
LIDQVQKWILHLGDLKLEDLVEGMKERVPTEEEEDPRKAPHEPLRPPVIRGEDWRGLPLAIVTLGDR